MFTINGYNWEIMAVPPNYFTLYRSDGSRTIGSCDASSRIIYINAFLEGDLLYKVLCHEVTHAAMFSYGISLSVEQEELIADLVATYGEEIINITDKIFQKLKGRLY